MLGAGRLTLVLPNGGREQFELRKAHVCIGRAATGDIVLSDPGVSRNHARIECGPAGCVLADLGSVNGTFVNGRQIEQEWLSPGDKIAIGAATLVYERPGAPEDPEVTRIDTEEELDASLASMPIQTHLQETGLPRLAVHTPERTWELPLDRDVVAIGRHPDNDVVIESPRVSRRHARITRWGAGFSIEDLKSDNGTWIDGRRVESRRVLHDCDTVRIGTAALVFKDGFGEQDLTIVGPAVGNRRKRRPVVAVPGFMGSNLWLGSERIWPNARGVFTDPELFRYHDGAPPVEARGLADELIVIPNLIKQQHYGRLVHYLEEALGYERGKDLLEFAYDFRQDVRVSARQLGAAIEKWAMADPVTIVAHSMGCLVSRYYVDCLGGDTNVERMILLGGPHHGAPKSLVTLLSGPQLLPFGLMGSRVRDVLRTFPSMYQLLPDYRCGRDGRGEPVDWLADPSWLPEPQRALWRVAAEFRSELQPRPLVPVVCIFGYGLKTIARVDIDRDETGCCRQLRYETEDIGDATVPETSAILAGADIHPVRQEHGTLHTDSDVKKRLKLELMGRDS